ncbi:hsdS specificity protein of type I restriction-modification system [Pseudoscardovia radai]|uniref:HsdS specificity protein of type I restriction-modification system n=2 Tax=Pseudoscardovia radai TaxID=987066 RepID=A0A261ERA6_9BIFI|nr:restriction endonuclease subunit S [Pseudoscardovia radai]OZG49375.1 hsdS specificity protein of type I restriction-modification system [Pseudoscardovia radai]
MAKKNSKKTVPELRFRGFTDPWEQRQLGEVVVRRSAQAISTEDMPSVEYEDVEAGRGALARDFTSKEGKRGICFEPGDVLYGKLRPYLGNRLKPGFRGVAVGDWWVLAPSSVASSFLFSLIQSPRFITIANQSSGSKMPRADWELVGSAAFGIPSLPEQRRIGVFFSTLDSLIAAAERQETLLKQKKQAYLQLMFPREGETQPRLRFSGFSEDWEQRRSSEQFVPVKENGHSDLPVLSATQSEGMVYRDDQSRDIKFKTDNLSSYKLVRAGDFVISLRSFQGGFELSDKTGIVSPAYTVFTHAECSSQDNAYWKQYFKRKSFIESLKTVTFGIRDGKTISFSDFSSLKCIFPSLPEQRRIGEFFTTLDNLIAATEERTRALKEMKSAYLQRMFV